MHAIKILPSFINKKESLIIFKDFSKSYCLIPVQLAGQRAVICKFFNNFLTFSEFTPPL